MTNVKKNFLYNILYEILILIIPFLTTPYLSRVIGPEGIGIYSYTYSVVYYFMILTLLGVNNYGNRSVAKVRDNKERLSKTFWSIYTMQLIIGLIMILIYITYVLLFSKLYKTIAILELLFIVSSILDINWLFFGLEEFKVTITRNALVKILSIILIFIFVKTSLDLWKYVLIMSSTTVISQLFIWLFVKEKVNFCKINFNDIRIHIKPNIILFIPIIAVSIYKIMDKIMLGSMSNIVEVGYYENAEKIINIPISIITALGTVMLPRISNLVEKNENEQILKYIYKSEQLMMFMSCPICLGLIAISDIFVPLFLGEKFIKTALLVKYLSVTIIFLGFANVIRKQYLVPKERDKDYIYSVLMGAFVNFIVNWLLIPKMNSVGACIGTIIAELFVAIYQILIVKNELPVIEYIKEFIKFFIKSLIMFMIIEIIHFIPLKPFFIIILQIMIGILIYFILNLKYIKSIINFKKILRRFHHEA